MSGGHDPWHGGPDDEPDAWGPDDPFADDHLGVAGWSDADFWALARRVRQTAEQELAELEQETERALLKREDLTARSVRAMMEGERWQVAVGSRTVEGIVVHAAMNFLGLQDRAGNLHDVVHAAIAMIRVVEVDPTQGRAPITFRPATFRARLLSLEQLRPVELAGATGGWNLRGTIESVNSDHLVLVEPNDQVSLIPIDAIGSLSRTPPRHRRLPPGAGRRDRS